MNIISNYRHLDGSKYDQINEIQIDLFIFLHGMTRKEAEYFSDVQLGILCY